MAIHRQEVALPLANAPKNSRTDNGSLAHRQRRPLRERRLSRWASWYAPWWALEPNHPAGPQPRSPR